MKRFFIYTLICSLTALMGCDKNDEVMNDLATTNGKKVTVTANIQGDAATRVTLTQDNTDLAKPFVKVDWKASDETFNAYADGVAEPIVFTQIDGTNRFEGTLNGTAPYTLYYGAKDYDLSAQDGTLNEAYVLMQATTDFSTTTIDFAHKTAILKPTFEVGDEDIDASITKIVMGGIKNPSATTGSGSITVTPSALRDIYIFLPAFTNYEGPHTFTFNVTADGQDYEATLTIPESRSIEAGKFYTATIKLTIPYLTFTAQGAQTFTMNTKNYTLDDKFEYSVDGSAWTQFTAGAPIDFGGANGNLRLRGKSSTGTATSVANAYSKIEFEYDTPVSCTGDIRTLVNWESFNSDPLITADAKFCRLFEGCTQLATAPELPATTLAANCYASMFNGCAQLTTAPELPATTLAANCYESMFSGCTILTTAPELPATTLAANCYASMFNGCTQLTTAPELPATTLAANCYRFMFCGCTNLTTVPEQLPATTLAANCYSCMFSDCTKLQTAPELPAETLAEKCYEQMFARCTLLTTAPELLPATTLADNCYYGMFMQCINLQTAPILPATSLATSCYVNMFNGCSALNKITMLATDISASGCLSYWVYGVSATGTFTKAASLMQGTESGQIPTGVSGIPSGWTVVDYTGL